MNALTLSMLYIAPALAAASPPPTDGPRCAKEGAQAGRVVIETLRRLSEAYADALPGPDGQVHRDRQIDAMLARSMDLSTFAERVLRRTWKPADDVTKKRWREALGGMLHRKYRQRLGRPDRVRAHIITTASNCTDSSVVLGLTRIDATGAARSTATTTLQLRFTNGRWRVYDVKVGEVSLLATWRSRFKRIFQKGGLKEVDRELRLMAKRYPCMTAECRLFQAP